MDTEAEKLAAFEPFAGVRYDPSRVDIEKVIAPPYDIVDSEERERLAAGDPHNVVHLDIVDHLPDGYTSAATRLRRWLEAGILVEDDQPAFYAYEVESAAGSDDGPVRTRLRGVVGALELQPLGQGRVMAHERTMSRAKDDRLRLMRACRANLSPVWCLTLARGLGDLLPADRVRIAEVRHLGSTHSLSRIVGPSDVAEIASLVGGEPLVIADGHHRYETALTYMAEREKNGDGDERPHRIMALVTEADDGPDNGIEPIHRVLALDEPLIELSTPADRITLQSLPTGAALQDGAWLRALAGPVLVLPGRAFLILAADGGLTDAELVEPLMERVGARGITYTHRGDEAAAVFDGSASAAGLLLRPPTAAQIAAAARAGRRLPPKTSFFTPKPLTGMLFRRL